MFDEQPDGNPHGECAEEIARLRADLETVTRQRDAILQQARFWSGEAKTQKSTVDQVGEILGGVPDWGPIAAGVDKLRADLAASQAECERLRRGEYICKQCGLRKDSEPGESRHEF